MFADIFFVTVLIVVGIIASYTDIKRREVPDWINYFLISVGIGGHILVSLIQNSFWPILYSGTAALILFIIANIMFYSGSWGGGDAKFLVGLGAILPIYPVTLFNFLNPQLAQWPFLITLFFNGLLIGAIGGLIFMIYKAILNWKKVKDKLKIILNKKKIKIIRISIIISLILLVILNFLFNLTIPIFIWIISTCLFYLILLSTVVEEIAMLKKIKPSQLTEGDWLLKDIKVGNKLIYKKKKIGIEKKDIDLLIKLEKEGKLKQVIVKEGLPLIPFFFIGILISLIYGDILFRILINFI